MRASQPISPTGGSFESSNGLWQMWQMVADERTLAAFRE
jgi:hypothetical protein